MIINSIDTKDISFVVQGAVDEVNTKLCLDSIRRNFPGCTIILSTWENTNIRGLTYDKIIFNKDPGSAVYNIGGTFNNINRQILSSYEGLKSVTTQYAAKVRSDLIFESPVFLTYFNKFLNYNEDYRLVKSRMIILSMYSRNLADISDGVHLQNYHPSDWFCFGYTEDVIKYYSAPLIPSIPEFSRFFLDFDKREKLPYEHAFFQHCPEQYLGAYFRGLNASQENIITLSDVSRQKDSLQFLVNNFIILDYHYSQIYCGKWKEISRDEFKVATTAVGLFFYGDFLRYYKRYCDTDYVIPDNIDKKMVRRKLRTAKEFLWRDKICGYLHKPYDICKNFAKNVFKKIFFAYRTAVRIEAAQQFHFDLLVSKLNELSYEQEHLKEEICELKNHLSHNTESELGD